MFAIRTEGDTTPVLAAVRETILRADAALTIVWARSVEDRVAEQLVQDRITGRLGLVFGVIAMTLAAIGLYGVLSYAIARRSVELSIRIALGAQPGQLIGMLLRETSALVLAGLVPGVALAYGATRLIANQLYGVAPHDPLAAGVAIGTLVVVALAAAYVPAHRASRLDLAVGLKQT